MIFRQMLVGKGEDYLNGHQALYGQQMTEKQLSRSGGILSSTAGPTRYCIRIFPVCKWGFPQYFRRKGRKYAGE